ncbi:WD repeat-containing protein 76-like [Macrosteles quadrilineatus]|uniref:WD repeat-containing protein 76-like n=1 Tax=Macrosteles quadrilineatus TaxID=74068 RepID=UPI0023E298C2|nr:WD repeat-containing protein 76-like [Macrosteles quadrilineatus]
MENQSETPSQRKYPQRNRKKVKYWYEDSDISIEDTPKGNKVAKINPDESGEDSSCEKENNNENESDENGEEMEEKEEISEYEKLRLKNLEENRRIMMELGLLNPKKEQKEETMKPKPTKPKSKPAQKVKLEPRKRSLRLLRKTPEGRDLPLTFEETPETPEIEEKTRIEEESLPMNEDGMITDFLDSLKLSLSQGSSSQSSMESTDSLIQDMRKLEFATLQKVTKSKVHSMCVHPMENKLLIVVGSTQGELGLWDVNNSQVVQFTPHMRPVNCVSVSHNNPSELFTTSFDGTVRCANINRSTIDLVYQTDEKSSMCHLTWHTQLDSNNLLVAHGTGDVGVVDLRTKSVERWYHCHPRSVRTIHIHPTKPQYFLTGSGTGEAKVWDLRASKKHNDEPVSTLCQGGKALTSVFFSPDGNKAVATCNDDRIRIYDTSDLTTAKELHSILHDNHTGRWLSVFKAIWHTHSSDLIFVGSLLQPRRIQMYNGSGRLVKDLMDEQLTTVVPVISLHPTLPIIVGGNSSGKAHIFTTPQYISQYID